MIPVAEIFGPTIQGEGPNSGLKSIFVRVVGCDFKCEWCDSKFAWNKDENTKYYTEIDLASEIATKCRDTNTSHVILTGGNPCLYNFSDIIDILHECGVTVDIETQGSILPDWLNKLDLVVISPKAPSSKMPSVWETVYQWLLKNKNVNTAIKIPVFNEEDLQFVDLYYRLLVSPDNFTNLKLYINVGNAYTEAQDSISKQILSDYKRLIEKICNSNYDKVYIMPQIHTLVWGNRQGV